MLQLAEELSLVQVFKKIPEEQLQIPHTLIERYIQLRQSGPPEESISFRFKFLQGYTGLNGIALDFASSFLSLVGHIREGLLLVCRIGYDPTLDAVVSFIDSFDSKKHQLKNLYKHNFAFRCVGCSANSDLSLLAITLLDKQLDMESMSIKRVRKFYESLVVEITGDKPTRYKLRKSLISASFPQSVQVHHLLLVCICSHL